MVASFGATIALAVSGALERIFNLGGLPALPLLSVAFLLVNADLLWRRLRASRRAEPSTAEEPSPRGAREVDTKSAQTRALDGDTLEGEGGGRPHP
jgi:hypothetical protein